MKKTILAICTVFIASVAMAQDEGNKMWLGGTVSFSSTSNDADDKTSNLEFGPTFGYMVNENIAVGLGLSISSGKMTDGTTDAETKMNGFSVMPFARYYKGINDNFKMYGELAIEIGSSKTEYDGGGESKYSTFGVGVGPGLQYWFADNWSVNAYWGLLGYSSTTDKSDGADDFKETAFTIGLDFTSMDFGLNFHF